MAGEVAKKELSFLDLVAHEDYINKGRLGLKIPEKIGGTEILMVPVYIIAGYVYIPWRFVDVVGSRVLNLQLSGATKDFVLYIATAMLVGLAWPIHILKKIQLKK